MARCCVTVETDRAGARRDELWIESVERIIKVENQSQCTFAEIAAEIWALPVSVAALQALVMSS